MSVSVIIPALNEEGTVADVVRACLADDPLEVLVIDADSQGNASTALGAPHGEDDDSVYEVMNSPASPGRTAVRS